MSLQYPRIPTHLLPMLQDIEPTDGGDGLLYYPCMVELRNGQTVDFVYVCEATSWFKVWGVWPEDDRGKRSLSIEDIATISESPSRLPPRIAKQIYGSGESGMGYQIFTLHFIDGSRQAYGSGNAVDFIEYPDGLGQKDIAHVEPHEGRMAAKITSPDYIWCLFSE